ncbi:hypothetical protein, partial [Actinocorallia lasiicapitis]
PSRALLAGAALTALLIATAAAAVAWWPDGGEGTAEGAVLLDGVVRLDQGWDGYEFTPDATGDSRSIRGYERAKGTYAVYADRTDSATPALSPIPAKAPASPEPALVVSTTATPSTLIGSGLELGLLCRWNEDDGTGYQFFVSDTGKARVARYATGTANPLGTGKADRLAEGEEIKLQASCVTDGAATRLRFWVNGSAVLDATDPQALPGKEMSQVGLMLLAPESGDNKIIASFSRFTVARAS